jgi:uncharacterized protein (TIGR02145 family)
MKNLSKITIWIVLLTVSASLKAQDYRITFAISQSADLPTQVKVENMTQDKSIIINGSEILNLVSEVTGINNELASTNTELKVFPNPINETANIVFFNPTNGNVSVIIYNTLGQKVLENKTYLSQGEAAYTISGLNKGNYVINVITNNYSASIMVISLIDANKGPAVSIQQTKLGNVNPSQNKSATTHTYANVVQMQYNQGDILKFTAEYNDYNSEISNYVATKDDELEFLFGYSITYHLNNGKNADDAPLSYMDESSFPIVLPVNPQSDYSYVFQGWYNNKELTGVAITEIPEGSNGEKEYWASWDYSRIADIEDNIYNNVTIGKQVWMTENLRTTTLPTGELIMKVESTSEWYDLMNSFPMAYCWYGNDSANYAQEFGALYTFTAATNGSVYTTSDVQGVCPIGWHMPHDGEWKEMELYLGMSKDQANSMGWRGNAEGSEMAGNSSEHPWDSGILTEDLRFETSGFSALASGYRDCVGEFFSEGNECRWWCSTQADDYNSYYRMIKYNKTTVYRAASVKNAGYSVRCVKNLALEPTVNFEADETEVILGTKINFTDLTMCNEISTWLWDFGDGTTSEEQSPTHIYTTTDTFTVTLTVVNDYGTDSITKEKYIVVTQSPFYGTVSDIDGNVYNTVEIDDQLWMAENLRVTKYADGTPIPNVDDRTEDGIGANDDAWGNLNDNNSDKAYCWYNNDSVSYSETCGALYTFAAATNGTPHEGSDVQGACPDDWHLPSDEELKSLEMHLGMSEDEANDTQYRGTNEGSKLAGETESTNWVYGPLVDNSEFSSTSFNLLPAGRRGGAGTFDNNGSYGFLWSSTESSSTYANFRNVFNEKTQVRRYTYYKSYGYSIRCLKDEDLGSEIEPINNPKTN